jgi:hypothetical protein
VPRLIDSACGSKVLTIISYFYFPLTERKIEIRLEIKYRSAEGKMVSMASQTRSLTLRRVRKTIA